MSRLSNFLDNRFTDGGEVVSFTPRPPFISGRFLVFIFVRGCVDPRGHCVAGRNRSLEKSKDLIGNRNRNLPACSIVVKQLRQHASIPNSKYGSVYVSAGVILRKVVIPSNIEGF
jgi:hypothetical protein